MAHWEFLLLDTLAKDFIHMWLLLLGQGGAVPESFATGVKTPQGFAADRLDPLVPGIYTQAYFLYMWNFFLLRILVAFVFFFFFSLTCYEAATAVEGLFQLYTLPSLPPVWILCLIRYEPPTKAFPHSGHTYGFSPVWILGFIIRGILFMHITSGSCPTVRVLWWRRKKERRLRALQNAHTTASISHVGLSCLLKAQRAPKIPVFSVIWRLSHTDRELKWLLSHMNALMHNQVITVEEGSSRNRPLSAETPLVPGEMRFLPEGGSAFTASIAFIPKVISVFQGLCSPVRHHLTSFSVSLPLTDRATRTIVQEAQAHFCPARSL